MTSLPNLRSDALRILNAALQALDPASLVKKALQKTSNGLSVGGKEIRFDRPGRIIIIGAGKAAAPMACAVEQILGDRLFAGAIVVKYGHGLPLSKIRLMEADHPVPDEQTLIGTRAILDLLQELTSDDLVLVLLSGGGSALFELPAHGITLADLQQTNSILLACGANIAEINAVRKHISQVKGGQLLRFTHPARVVTLALSDVIGDPPEAIASGPTVPDSTTFRDVQNIFVKYGITDKLPKAILEHINGGLLGQIPDTPKPGDPIFDPSLFQIIGNNRLMLEAAKRDAESRGYQVRIVTDCLQGETRDQGRNLAAMLKEEKTAGKPICLLAGGETTVTLKGSDNLVVQVLEGSSRTSLPAQRELVVQVLEGSSRTSLPAQPDLVVQASLPALGLGGRNQELALAAAIELDGSLGFLLLSAGSDGSDGPTDAAGAIAEGTTLARAAALGMNASAFLDRNDSYNFFKPLNDLVITGPTLTNVMDLVIMLKDRT